MEIDEECFEVYTEPEDFQSVVDALDKSGYSFLSAQVEMIPQTYVKLENEEDIKNMQKMLDMFEDNDDVKDVWYNWEND